MEKHSTATSVKNEAESLEAKWIQYKFRFNDDPAKPDWWLDIFLIDTVIRDIVKKHKPGLWRFHRRSAKDSVGHQLSFMIYSEQSLKVYGPGSHVSDIFVKPEQLYADLNSHPSVELLNQNNLLKAISFEEFEDGIEKTSDPGWSEAVQKSWPYFACGACQMILGLLRPDNIMPDCMAAEYHPSNLLGQIREYYDGLNSELNSVFTNNASHIFVHHLSALFGYAPIRFNI